MRSREWSKLQAGFNNFLEVTMFGRNWIAALVLIFALILWIPVPLHATTVSSTFAATGNSTALFVKGGEKFRYVTTGTWVATVQVLESNNNGIAYQRLETYTANANTDFDAKPYDRLVRLTATAYTSGTVTYSLGNVVTLAGAWKVKNVEIGSVAYASLGTNTTPVAGTWYCMDVNVLSAYTSMSGMGFLNGATVGTDTAIYALYDSTGRLVANTSTSGVTTSGASAAQEIAFASQVALSRGIYWMCEQVSGTTTRLRTVAASTFLDKLAGSFTGTAGTVPSSITVPTTFTADTGPIGYIYP